MVYLLRIFFGVIIFVACFHKSHAEQEPKSITELSHRELKCNCPSGKYLPPNTGIDCYNCVCCPNGKYFIEVLLVAILKHVKLEYFDVYLSTILLNN
jgi:hypothetical protein